MSKDREIRTFLTEFRVSSEPDSHRKISGHAAVFNRESQDLGDFREIIQKGCFASSLTSADVRALWNHDTNIVLGRNKSGTLRLHEDDVGLFFDLDMPDTQLVRDMVMTPIERGDVTACSFGFRAAKDKWEKRDGGWVRTLLECEVFDVSPCTFPAYTSTDVAVRSMQQAIKAEEPDNIYMIDLMKRRLQLIT